MTISCTGVILSGGMSSRFSGKNKAFLQVGGRRILDRIYDVFNDVFEEIILVTNEPLQFLEYDLNIVTDLFPVRSSLTGIHAGLFHMSTPFGFFAACDCPFLKKRLVETIVAGIEENIDVVIPDTSAGLEPLCAVYSKRCEASAEQNLVQNKLKIQRVFKRRRIKKISEKKLRAADPDLLSFFNINTPDDFVSAEQIIKQLDTGNKRSETGG